MPFANPNNYVHAARRLAERLAETEPGGPSSPTSSTNLANRRAQGDHGA